MDAQYFLGARRWASGAGVAGGAGDEAEATPAAALPTDVVAVVTATWADDAAFGLGASAARPALEQFGVPAVAAGPGRSRGVRAGAPRVALRGVARVRGRLVSSAEQLGDDTATIALARIAAGAHGTAHAAMVVHFDAFVAVPPVAEGVALPTAALDWNREQLAGYLRSLAGFANEVLQPAIPVRTGVEVVDAWLAEQPQLRGVGLCLGAPALVSAWARRARVVEVRAAQAGARAQHRCVASFAVSHRHPASYGLPRRQLCAFPMRTETDLRALTDWPLASPVAPAAPRADIDIAPQHHRSRRGGAGALSYNVPFLIDAVCTSMHLRHARA